MLELPPGRGGVLPNQYLEQAIKDGVIHAGSFEMPIDGVQPASLDLRLGPAAHRVRYSFLPSGQKVEKRLKDAELDQFPLDGQGAILVPGQPYIIPLKEQLNLPPGMRAKANPKSSTGRADVFTRVITDEGYRFDEIAEGYEGPLYLEVVPLSFPIQVREDISLNQLRLSVGRTELSDSDIRAFHTTQPLVFADDLPVSPEDLRLSDGLFLGLDLRNGKTRNVGYRARTTPPLLDMTQVGNADPKEYWDKVEPETGHRIILAPKYFYLLMSFEAVTIPPTLAAEMTAYDPTSGELRTHYAGFFDPGFGFDSEDQFKGSTAALEVRAHDVPFMIEHRQPVCKLTFEQMLDVPTQLYGAGIGSNYQRQTETLGKHFRLPRTGAISAGSRRRAGSLVSHPDQLDLLGQLE